MATVDVVPTVWYLAKMMKHSSEQLTELNGAVSAYLAKEGAKLVGWARAEQALVENESLSAIVDPSGALSTVLDQVDADVASLLRGTDYKYRVCVDQDGYVPAEAKAPYLVDCDGVGGDASPGALDLAKARFRYVNYGQVGNSVVVSVFAVFQAGSQIYIPPTVLPQWVRNGMGAV